MLVVATGVYTVCSRTCVTAVTLIPGRTAPGRCRSCRPRRRSCRRGSGPPGRTAAPSRRGSGVERWTPSKAISTTCSGRTWTTYAVVVGGLRASSVNRSVCQASISSVMPLNVLPSITKPPVSGSRAPRWMLDSQPCAPAAAPLDGEHDQVEGVHRLDLDPGGAAAAGVVRRREVLDDHALVTAGERLVDEGLRRGWVGGHQARDPVRPRAPGRSSAADADGPGSSSRSSPSRCSRSKKYGVIATPLPMRRARRGLLERARPAGLRRARSPRRRARASAGSARTTSTTSGSRCGDVLERAGGEQDLVAGAVRPGSGCRRASRRPRARPPPALASAAARSGALEASIGSTGRPTSSPNAASAVLAAGQGGDRDGGRRAGEHRGAAYGRERHGRRRGDRLLDQGVEGALADRAGDGAAQPGLLVGGGPAEQLGDRGRPRGLGARAGASAAIASNASCTSSTVRVGESAGSGSCAQPAPAQRRCGAGAGCRRGRT